MERGDQAKADSDVIDLHTHILPGLDDGPQTLDESIAIVRQLTAFGFDHFFLTPHFRQGFFESSADAVRLASKRLRAALGDDLPAVRFTEAHEVHLGSVLDSRGRIRDFLRFGPKEQYLLLELPSQSFPFDLLSRVVERLFLEGIRIVLAHPEKNEDLREQPSRYRELCERGVKLQVNVTSLAGFAGRRARRAAEALCNEGMIHAMGTDSHSLAQVLKFVPRGLDRVRKLLGDERLRSVADCAELSLDSSGEIRTWS